MQFALLTHSYHQQRCFGVGLAKHRLLAPKLCRQMLAKWEAQSSESFVSHIVHALGSDVPISLTCAGSLQLNYLLLTCFARDAQALQKGAGDA